ncbi:MAG TPA: AtaL-like protein [Allocoleopsis sp.]
MPYATYKTNVNSSVKTLWELLMDKIENPQRYVPGVVSVKILGKNDLEVLREMKTDSLTVTEKITWNQETKEIIFTLVDHPLFRGQVINKIWVNEENNQPMELEFTLDWQPLNPDSVQKDLDMSSAIQQAVLHTKTLAETLI